jgi:hypothetical protein
VEGVKTAARTRLAPTVVHCAFIFFLLSGLDLSACSYSSIPTKIGHNFTVGVFKQGEPVAGLQIELSTDPTSAAQKSRTIQVVRTGANGLAEFAKIHRGLYYIGIKHPAFAYSEELQVMRHPPTNSSKTITFEWPGWKPLLTQTVSGVLTGRARTDRGLGPDLAKPVYGQVPGAKLTLSRAVSNEVIDTQTTGETGTFDFKHVASGFYFLRVETTAAGHAHWFPSDGYVPVEVDPSAKFQDLNLVLDNAICGELAWGRREEVKR